MTKEDTKNLRLIDCENKELDASKKESNLLRHSNPIKSDLYLKLNSFRNSKSKLGIQDIIKDSLK